MKNFSDDQFYEALNSEDPLGMVLRGHLCIEYEVNRFLHLAMPLYRENEEKIKAEYYQKVFFCCSLGLSKELLEPLKSVGRIRNKFAHDLDAKLDNIIVNEVYKSFSGAFQKQLKDSYAQLAVQFQRDQKKFTDLNERARLELMFMFMRKKMKQANTQLENQTALKINE